MDAKDCILSEIYVCNIGQHVEAYGGSCLQELATYCGTASMSCNPRLQGAYMSWEAFKLLPSPILTSLEGLQPGQRSLMHLCTSTKETRASLPSPTATLSRGQVCTLPY